MLQGRNTSRQAFWLRRIKRVYSTASESKMDCDPTQSDGDDVETQSTVKGSDDSKMTNFSSEVDENERAASAGNNICNKVDAPPVKENAIKGREECIENKTEESGESGAGDASSEAELTEQVARLQKVSVTVTQGIAAKNKFDSVSVNGASADVDGWSGRFEFDGIAIQRETAETTP